MRRLVSFGGSSLIVVSATAGAVLAFAGSLAAQLPVDTAMKLNRVGQWVAASSIAREQLSKPGLSGTDRCRVAVSLTYAEHRLSRTAEATVALRTTDSLCAATGDSSSVRELRALRDEKPAVVSGGAGAVTSAVRAADTFWQLTTAESVGVSPTALKAHLELCQRTGADACLVIRHDKIVQEWYSSRYAEPMMAMSSTKSVTGLLITMLRADGKLHGLDDTVCRYIASWCTGVRGLVTIRQLMSMTSGLPMQRADSSVGFVADKDRFVIGLVPKESPGTTWAYSNEGAQLLSPILDAAAGEPIQAYAAKRLFGPAGMRNTSLHIDQAGHAWTYAGMYTTARDFARIGVLALHRGNWLGTQVFPEHALDTLTTPQPLNSHYGLLWWLDPEAHAYATHGHLDTDIHVLPALDLIVVRMQSKPYPGVREGEYERALLPMLGTFVVSQ
ncbi:MAG TPA: serine hydrolase [Gemmatimonadales bacterium]|nr:serine hydrolase [Gemmatimonadales bacterium]